MKLWLDRVALNGTEGPGWHVRVPHTSRRPQKSLVAEPGDTDRDHATGVRGLENSQGRLLACRIELTGRCALHGELLTSTEHLLAEARAAALGLGEEAAWIERLIIATNCPETPALRKDALGDLQRMIDAAASDTGLQAQLASDLGDLIRKLPHDVRADVEDAALKAAIDGDTASLIRHAGGYLAARLAGDPIRHLAGLCPAGTLPRLRAYRAHQRPNCRRSLFPTRTNAARPAGQLG
jgi:hypothetical protein